MLTKTLLNLIMFKKKYLPILFGISVFFIIVGALPLDPTNINWLLNSGNDPAQHYLGWAFFKLGDWTYPIGLNPQFGLQISSSIIFSDSIPLLAIFFKLLSSHVTIQFQYFGIWLLLCFIFQACFSWKLLGLITPYSSIKFLGTGFFIFAPPLLFRIGLHTALVGQFVILAALYFNLADNSQRRAFWWLILLISTVLIHFYLFVMVFALWVSSCAHAGSLKVIFREMVLIFFVVGVVAWQAGYFIADLGEVSATGYGFYNLNLLSLFNSHQWSYLIPEIPTHNETGESFNYFGLGSLILILFAIPPLLMGDIKIISLLARWWVLCLTLLVLTIFSISNHISIGVWTFSYPLPPWFLNLANILRSSGRFFWPVYYSLLFLIIFILIRTYSKKTTILILFFALVVQVIDTSAGWLPIRIHLQVASQTPYRSPLVNPLWVNLTKCYSKVIRIPVGNPLADWIIFAQFSAQHALGTNSVYLSRTKENLYQANNELMQNLKINHHEPKAIYVIGDEEVALVFPFLNKENVLGRLDGYNLLIPSLQQCPSLSLPANFEITDPRSSPRIHEKIGFTRQDQYTLRFLKSGWAFPETWGTWSASAKTTLLLPLPQKPANTLRLQLRALVSAQHPQQRVGVLMDGQSEQQFTLTSPSSQTIEIVLPNHSTPQRLVKIELNLPDRIRPKNLGMGNDDRELAIGLESASFH